MIEYNKQMATQAIQKDQQDILLKEKRRKEALDSDDENMPFTDDSEED